MSYCDYCNSENAKQVHKDYHDNHYGFPVESDDLLFERLVLEINQAGLSWETILKKQEGFRRAYDNFDIRKVANYSDVDRERLLSDPAIIRNKRKIDAAIFNAKQILLIQEEFGSFSSWIHVNQPLELNEWVKLFKSKFKFVGGEIVNEFLMSIGVLEGAHDKDCPIFDVLNSKSLNKM